RDSIGDEELQPEFELAELEIPGSSIDSDSTRGLSASGGLPSDEYGPFGRHELHRKLSSPDRKRPSPAVSKQRQEKKHLTAELNRAQLASGAKD
ncbi:unnamed protein product, partial [Chrysoparadoxa australica]